MPIYEYGCGKCGVVEVTQRISEPPLQKCPNCRRKVQRLISSTSFQLKGSGWYVTDYARGGGKGKDTSSKDAASKDSKSSDASSSSSSSESKSDTKSSPSSSSGGTSESTSS